jgi:hypothetical protein
MAACGGIAVIDASGGGGSGGGGSGGASSSTTNSTAGPSTSPATQVTATTGPGPGCDGGYVPCCEAACLAAIALGCEFGPHSLDDCACDDPPGGGLGCEDSAADWFYCLANTPSAYACDGMSNLILVCEECATERGGFEVACGSSTTCGGI